MREIIKGKLNLQDLIYLLIGDTMRSSTLIINSKLLLTIRSKIEQLRLNRGVFSFNLASSSSQPPSAQTDREFRLPSGHRILLRIFSHPGFLINKIVYRHSLLFRRPLLPPSAMFLSLAASCPIWCPAPHTSATLGCRQTRASATLLRPRRLNCLGGGVDNLQYLRGLRATIRVSC